MTTSPPTPSFLRTTSRRAVMLRPVMIAAALLGAGFGAPSARAETVPSDEDLLSATIVAVVPTSLLAQDAQSAQVALAAVMSLPASSAACRQLAALAPLDLEGAPSGVAPKANPPEGEGPQGFGFQGSSDAGDVVALQAGYVLGRIATHAAAGDLASVRTMARWVEAREGALDFLSDSTAAALVPFISDAVDGRVDMLRLMQLLQATEQGLGNAEIRGQVEIRGHGYLAAGIWAGMALLGSTTDTGRANLVVVGSGLISALDQDAAFDASDKVISAALKTILSELTADGPRPAVVNDAGRALMTIRADSEQ
jgi:hypothetical protein